MLNKSRSLKIMN